VNALMVISGRMIAIIHGVYHAENIILVAILVTLLEKLVQIVFQREKWLPLTNSLVFLSLITVLFQWNFKAMISSRVILQQ